MAEIFNQNFMEPKVLVSASETSKNINITAEIIEKTPC